MGRAVRLFALVFLLGSLLLSAASGVSAATARRVPSGAQAATVRGVVNGDTYRVTLDDGTKTTIALLAVAAPDPDAKDAATSCYGDEAKAQAEKLLKPGREIWLEKDKTNKDKNGRLLRYVWVKKSNGDAYLLNEVLLRDGYAVYVASPRDTKHADDLQKAHDGASAANRGLWDACAEYLPTPVPAAGSASSGGYTPDEVAYAALVTVITQQLGNYLGDLGEHFQSLDNIDDAWITAVATDLQGIHTSYAQLQQITPPPAFADMHALLLEAARHYDQAATDVESFFTTLDPYYLQLAADEITTGGTYLDQATAELNRIQSERGGL